MSQAAKASPKPPCASIAYMPPHARLASARRGTCRASKVARLAALKASRPTRAHGAVAGHPVGPLTLGSALPPPSGPRRPGEVTHGSSGPPLRRGHFDRAAARPSPRRARQRGSSRGASIARVAARRRGSAGAVPRPAAFRGMEMVMRCGMVRRRGMARGGEACRSSRRSRSTAASASISASCPRSAPGEVKGEGKGSR